VAEDICLDVWRCLPGWGRLAPSGIGAIVSAAPLDPA
jgi:hypothetical protein